MSSSWKKQSSRLQTGHMKSVNNDFLYSESASFNNLESINSYVNNITSEKAFITDLSSNRGTFNDISVNNLFITNLGQNIINYDKWIGVDLSKQLLVFDLSSAGNFTNYGGHSMMKNKKGWGSTAFGYDTMRNLSSNTDISFANTAVGTRAMYGCDPSDSDYVITGTYNSAFGFESLRSIISGNNNSAFGYQSLKNVTTGIDNTSVGGSSLLNNTTGNQNVAIGARSLLKNTTGNYNIATGTSAMNLNTIGSQNVACGSNSLMNNNTGSNNTAIGYNSMFKNVSGFSNSALGTSSLYNNSGGVFNTGLGYMSLYSNTIGSNNVAVGNQSLYNNVDSCGNTAIGNLSMYNNIGGLYNSAIGFNSMYNNKSGMNNSAIGYNSMFNSVDNSCNTALGAFTLYNNSGGEFNVGVGYQSMYANTTGGKSTSLGNLSLCSNTTGSNNVAVGNCAMNYNTDASCNTAVGSHSLYTNTVGLNNTGLGYMTLYSNTTGSNNVAIGTNALYTGTTGVNNTVVGCSSDVINVDVSCVNMVGFNNTSAYSNVNILGANISASGANRTFIGNVADSSSSLISNVVMYDPITKEMSYDSRMLHKVAVDASGHTNIILGDLNQNTSIGGLLFMTEGKEFYTSSSKTFGIITPISATFLRIGKIVYPYPETDAYLDFNDTGGSTIYGSDSFNINVPTFNINSTIINISGDTLFNKGITLKRDEDAIDMSNNIKFGTNSNGHYLYGIGSNPLRFFTDGADRMRVDQSGNIGIGESNPDNILTNTKLQIQATLAGAPNFIWDNTWGLSLTNDTSTNTIGGGNNTRPALSMGLTSGNNPTAYISSVTPLKNWNNLMIDATNICLNGLNTNGNVGIGTATPTYPLDVSGTTRLNGAVTTNGNTLNCGAVTTNGNTLNCGAVNCGAVNCGAINTTGYNIDCGTGTVYANTHSASQSARFTSPDTYVTYINNDKSTSGNVEFNTSSPGSNLIMNTGHFYWSNSTSILKSNGYIGIGTSNPTYQLHITGAVSEASLKYYDNAGNFNNTPATLNICLKVSDGTLAVYYAVTSDTRIKDNIVDIDDEQSLQTLRLIKPKTYGYVDKVKRGNENVIGFIAQEIKAIIPKAVTITKDYIPSFYTLCQVAATDVSNIVLVTSPIDLSWNPLHGSAGNAFIDAAGNACSDASGNKCFNVKLYDQSNVEIICKTTNVLDKRSFLMDISGSKMVDSSGNLKDGDYFLYGQEVDDFHTLDKSAIFTVVTAAVQDIDRIQQAQAGQIQSQSAMQQADAIKIEALERQLKDLQNKYKLLEDKVEMILSKM